MSEKKAFQTGLLMGAILGGVGGAVAMTSADVIGDVVRSNVGRETVIRVPEDPKPEVVLPPDSEVDKV